MFMLKIGASVAAALWPAHIGFSKIAGLNSQLTTAYRLSSLTGRTFSSCNCRKDQTPIASLKALMKNKDGLGTGLFLIPAPEKGPLEWKVVAVKDLSYKDAVLRGTNCEALKWIAYAVLSHAQFEKARSVDCSNYLCDSDGTCPSITCICSSGQCH